MSKFDDKMRELEQPTNITLDRYKPVIIRVDGKAFHSYHKKFDGHFSVKMQTAMNDALMLVMKNISEIQFGYTNSDEMTFVLLPENVAYSNRVLKIASIVASIATAGFNKSTGFVSPAFFDARVYNVKNLDEVADILHWRKTCGMRNAVNTCAREFLSKSEMRKKTPDELEQKLFSLGLGRINRDSFYYGNYITRQTMELNMAKDNMYHLTELFLERR